MRITHCQKEDDVITQASEQLQMFLDQYAGQDVLLLVSAGSAFGLLHCYDVVDARHITVGVLDERWSHDEKINNFLQLKETELYKELMEHGARGIDTSIQEEESRGELASRFERALKNWCIAHPDGIVIVTMGIGPDGHTAGIFPHPENSSLFAETFDGYSWIASYDAVGKHDVPERITTTLRFLKDQVDHAVVVMTGEQKQKAFKHLVAEEGSLAETPARVMHEMRDVHMFTTLHV